MTVQVVYDDQSLQPPTTVTAQTNRVTLSFYDLCLYNYDRFVHHDVHEVSRTKMIDSVLLLLLLLVLLLLLLLFSKREVTMCYKKKRYSWHQSYLDAGCN